MTWSKGPLQPGQKSDLKVLFETKGKIGFQMEYIALIIKGSDEPVIVTFEGEVF